MTPFEWTGRFELEAAPGRAFVAFTPRGERGWAPGWEPVFHTPDEDDSLPGTVFEEGHGGHPTIWQVVDRRPGEYLRYSRVTPGVSAGTVTVRLAPRGAGSAVEVTYRMAALSAQGAAYLGAASTDPDTSPATWREPIEAFLRTLP
jgi:hypothetical protein